VGRVSPLILKECCVFCIHIRSTLVGSMDGIAVPKGIKCWVVVVLGLDSVDFARSSGMPGTNGR